MNTLEYTHAQTSGRVIPTTSSFMQSEMQPQPTRLINGVIAFDECQFFPFICMQYFVYLCDLIMTWQLFMNYYVSRQSTHSLAFDLHCAQNYEQMGIFVVIEQYFAVCVFCNDATTLCIYLDKWIVRLFGSSESIDFFKWYRFQWESI